MKRPKHAKNTIHRRRMHTQAVVRRRFRKVKGARMRYAFGLGMIISIVAAFVLWRSPDFLAETQTEVRFFQISTGPTGGTYYAVGRQIAAAISRPPGAESCDGGGPCGVDGVLAVGKASHGSVANARGVNSGRVQSALIQADIANWAFNGKEMFKTEGALKNLRAIASLYPETIHLVARETGEIDAFSDLRGKTVAIDRVGSGTHQTAKLLLQAFGIKIPAHKLLEVEPTRAADMLLEGKVDAFFSVSGTPSPVIQDLYARARVKLIPIEGRGVDQLLKTNPYLKKVTMENIYAPDQSINSLSVNALWVTNNNMRPVFVAELTKALWRKENKKLLSAQNNVGNKMTLQTAQDGISIPLHPGAVLFYRHNSGKDQTTTTKEQ